MLSSLMTMKTTRWFPIYHLLMKDLRRRHGRLPQLRLSLQQVKLSSVFFGFEILMPVIL